MKGILKNKKGFTLVELLAVIVVLAVIILIAMPSVMSAMEKARKNAFVTEINEIAKIAQTAYADKVMNDHISTACFNLKYLVENGYLDKNLEGYKGSVMISTTATDTKATIKIEIGNGTYSFKKDPRTASVGDLESDSGSMDDKCTINTGGGTTGVNRNYVVN